METASGPNTSTRVPLLVRAVVLAVSVAAVVVAFATYVPGGIGRIYPPANLIAHTWYGLTLVTLVPIALAWLSLAAKRKWLRVFGLSLSVLLLLACLNWIYVVREMSGTVPEPFRREHVL